MNIGSVGRTCKIYIQTEIGIPLRRKDIVPIPAIVDRPLLRRGAVVAPKLDICSGNCIAVQHIQHRAAIPGGKRIIAVTKIPDIEYLGKMPARRIDHDIVAPYSLTVL